MRMSTIGAYDAERFGKVNRTPVRTTIETLFYGNNVKRVREHAINNAELLLISSISH